MMAQPGKPMWCEHWILNSDSKDPHEEPDGECMPTVPVQGCVWEGVGQWGDIGVSLKSAGSPDDSVSSEFRTHSLLVCCLKTN